jgi:hypothetical protein
LRFVYAFGVFGCAEIRRERARGDGTIWHNGVANFVPVSLCVHHNNRPCGREEGVGFGATSFCALGLDGRANKRKNDFTDNMREKHFAA